MFYLGIIVFAVANALYEVIAKKYMNDHRKSGEWRLMFWISAIGALLSGCIYLFGINEHYSNPIEAFMDFPLIMAQFLLFAASVILCYIAIKYIEVAKEAAISYGSSVVFAIGIIIYGLVTHNDVILSEYITLPITMTIFMSLGGFVLLLALTFSAKEPENKPDYKQTLGILLALLAVICSGFKTVMDEKILGTNALDTMDYIGAFYSFGVVTMIISWVVITIKEKKIYNPFKISEDKDVIIADIFFAIGGLAFYSAFAINPEWADLGTSLVPIVTMILARKILLEKLKPEEYIALLIIILSVILLGIEKMGLIVV